MCVCMHMYLFVCTSLCVRVCVYMNVSTCMYMIVWVCRRLYARKCVGVLVCVCEYRNKIQPSPHFLLATTFTLSLIFVNRT